MVGRKGNKNVKGEDRSKFMETKLNKAVKGKGIRYQEVTLLAFYAL